MKILQICSKVPFPPKDGGSIAMNIVTQGLIKAGHEVNVLAVNTPKHFSKDEDIDAEYRSKTNYRSVFINTDVKPVEAFLNLFSSESYNVARFYSKDLENVLIDILSENKYDIIQLESLWVTPYLDCLRKHSKAKIVFRSHNIEYSIWERLAKASGSSLKKGYMNLLAKRLKKYELNILNKFDAVVSITKADKTEYENQGCKIPIIHLPFGIDPQLYKEERSAIEFPSVFHIGAMDWLPNIDGVNWILNKIWPEVLKRSPDLKLYLAGRKMPSSFSELKIKNVIVVGEVDDSHAFINSKSIMVVPLSSGGGMRVKIIEGMALGKTIISTAVGAEGIEYENNLNIIIANTANEFADAICKCASDKDFSEAIGKSARKLIEEKYNNAVICEKLIDLYISIIKK